MKKKWIGIIASILTVCMLTMGAFAASASVTISKGQSSVTSSTVSGNKATYSASNYSSSTETMQAYGMANNKVKWSTTLQIGKSGSGGFSDSTQTYSFKIQVVGNYYCNGKGSVTAS